MVNRVIEIRLDYGPALRVCQALGISAFTLGDCVIYAVPPCRNLRFHEKRHVFQYWLLGPFFLPAYYLGMAIWGYQNHPLEKDAHAYEARHCGCTYPSKVTNPYP